MVFFKFHLKKGSAVMLAPFFGFPIPAVEADPPLRKLANPRRKE